MAEPITLIVYLLVFILLLGLIFWAMRKLEIPEPFRTILIVIVAIMMIVILLRFLGMW